MEVGPGTPMGELLRRYWMPIARRRRAGRHADQGRAPDGRGPRPLQGQERHLRAGRPALPAPPRRPVLRLRRGVRPALQLPRLAVRRDAATASSSRSRRSRTRRRASRTASRIKAYPVEAKAGLLWAYMGPRRRRWCRPGSRSPGRTASSRSSSPRSPATGSSARRTPSTRCTSSGCTPTGRACCSGQTTARGRRPTCESASTSSSTASPTGASWRASRRTTSCGRSAACCLWPNACSPAATSSGACPSTTTPR